MCIIGPAEKDELPEGADSPIRTAAENAFVSMTGYDAENCWSGWGLTEERMEEIQEVWNREDKPNVEHEHFAR